MPTNVNGITYMMTYVAVQVLLLISLAIEPLYPCERGEPQQMNVIDICINPRLLTLFHWFVLQIKNNSKLISKAVYKNILYVAYCVNTFFY